MVAYDFKSCASTHSATWPVRPKGLGIVPSRKRLHPSSLIPHPSSLIPAAIRFIASRNALALASTLSVETPRPRYMPAAVLDLHHHLALGVLADRHAVDVKVLADDRDAGQLLDGQEDRVDRAVAAGDLDATSSARGAGGDRTRGIGRCRR